MAHADAAFDATRNAATRFAALSAMFDGNTTRHLLDRGLAPDWQCLEVGGGGGTIARWLCDRIGPRGRVVSTDIEPRFLQALNAPRLEVLRHDITRDPLPAAAFDLVHTRMVLIHLPERDDVLRRLAAALKPGGWLVCEEFDAVSCPPDPMAYPGERVLKAHEAMARLNDERGVDRRYGRLLFGRLRALGLSNVGSDAHLSMVHARCAAAALLRASYERRRRAMVDAGYLTDAEFDDDIARMEEIDFMMPSPILWTVWGQRR